MAKRLVEDMTEKWKPEQYKDTFVTRSWTVEKKAREGKLEAVGGPEEAVDRRSADVIDLTELLKRSRLPSRARRARRRGGRRGRCAGKGASQIQACEQGQDQQVVQLVTHTQGTGGEQQIQQEGQLRHGRAKGQRSPTGRRCRHQQPSAGDRRGQRHHQAGAGRVLPAVADWLVPQLAGRPLSIVRAPEGIGGELLPASLRPVEDAAHARAAENLDPEHARLIRADNITAVIEAVQMGSVEFHTGTPAAIASSDRTG